MKPMSRDAFVVATKEARWVTTEQIVEMLNDAEFWTWEFIAGAADDRKAAFARRMMRSLKSEDDVPLYANVKTRDEEGNEVRVYKQEELFDRDDYVQTVAYFGYSARDQYRTAIGYKQRGEAKYGGEIFVPSPLAQDNGD